MPTNALLERALSPLCSSHTVRLRSNREPESNPAKLKRRWSLFPIRRSKRANTGSGELTRNSKNRISLPLDSMTSSSRTLGTPEEIGPVEVVLMSPDERVKLLADQFSSPKVVPIDVSGRNFRRMSTGRRSLIHVTIFIASCGPNSNLVSFLDRFPHTSSQSVRSVEVEVTLPQQPEPVTDQCLPLRVGANQS